MGVRNMKLAVVRWVARRVQCVLVLGGIAWIPRAAVAQDPFEIEVYDAETAARGAWELDTHLNYIALGTTAYDASVAPTRHQTHLTFELTRGLTPVWEATAYVLAAYRPGQGVEYAGWRVRSRVRAPESWHLPVDLGIAAELEFSPAAYNENSTGLEIRPILSKQIGRLELDLNPVAERGLRGAMGPAAGWEFEPSARTGFALSQRVTLSVEYYSKTTLLGDAVRPDEQVHQIFPGVDVKLGDDLVLNAGVGFGTTAAGNRLVFKSHVEVPLGK